MSEESLYEFKEQKLEISRVNSNDDFWFSMVDNAVIYDEELTALDKAVYMVVCSHADVKTRSWILKNETIAKEAGCSVRTVQRSMAKLEERGIIKRHARFIERNQRANLIEIIGRHADCYREQKKQVPHELKENFSPEIKPEKPEEISRHDTSVTPYSDTGVMIWGDTESHQLQESCFTRNTFYEKKDKKTTATQATQNAAGEIQPEKKPEKEPERFSPSEAPEVMRSTAEYLLLKTGRNALTEPELSALRRLAAGHYPARVQKEIDTACDRFKRKNKNLADLNFCYIADALKYQASRPFTRAAPRKKSVEQSDEFKRAMAEFKELEKRETENQEYSEADLARLEAELAEEMRKNGF